MDCIVKVNETLSMDTFYLSLEPVGGAPSITPGQFVMIKAGFTFDPLLRRPMSVADFAKDGTRIGLVIKIAGAGTRILSTLMSWDRINLLGPFGNGFKVPDSTKNVWIVCGGTGVAPFLGLIENTAPETVAYTVFLGARTAEQILFAPRLEKAGAKVVTVTEDGSLGEKGLVTDVFKKAMQTESKPGAVLTCGPTGMMKQVASISEEYGILCQVSLENQMACGFGACLGCVAKTRNGDDYLTVCRAGPVFDSTRLAL